MRTGLSLSPVAAVSAQAPVRLVKRAVHWRLLVAAALLLALPRPAAAQQAETVEFYGHDAIGSIRIVWDANGNVLARQDYAPFGRQLFPLSLMPKEGFGAQEKDDETDQQYFHARMFQARTGRFTRPDPIQDGTFEPQRWNRYAYALNNPEVVQDPSGLNAEQNPDGTCDFVGTADDAPKCVFKTTSNKPGGGDGGGSSSFSMFLEMLLDMLTAPEPLGGPESEIVPTPPRERPSAGVQTAVAVAAVVATAISPLAKATEGEAAVATVATTAESAIGAARTAIGATGKIGEDALRALGGESQVYFRTSQGGRYVDQLVNGIANESKVGYQSLTGSISRQILKDVELMNSGQIQGAAWHFFDSPVTGAGGPSRPLLNMLLQAGIQVIIHP